MSSSIEHCTAANHNYSIPRRHKLDRTTANHHGNHPIPISKVRAHSNTQLELWQNHPSALLDRPTLHLVYDPSAQVFRPVRVELKDSNGEVAKTTAPDTAAASST